MKRTGVDALFILSLMSVGTGAVIAFLSALQLKLVGATIYVAALIAVAVVEEIGPLLTAILVSGRSGSAFAAEIGTMMVKEEVDALTAMGFDPLRFLAVPKVLATVAVLPLLTLYAMLFGIIGGFLVGVYLLDFTVYTYINETMNNVTLFDLVTSLIKSVVLCGGGGQHRLPAGLSGARRGRGCGDYDHLGRSDFAFSGCRHRMRLRHSFALRKVKREDPCASTW